MFSWRVSIGALAVVALVFIGGCSGGTTSNGGGSSSSSGGGSGGSSSGTAAALSGAGSSGSAAGAAGSPTPRRSTATSRRTTPARPEVLHRPVRAHPGGPGVREHAVHRGAPGQPHRAPHRPDPPSARHLVAPHDPLQGGRRRPTQATPFDCQPFQDTLNPADGNPLIISQKTDDLLTLPQGVAFDLDANQMVRLEMHYINANPTTGHPGTTSTLTTIPDADLQVRRVVPLHRRPGHHHPAAVDVHDGQGLLPRPERIRHFELLRHHGP